MFARLDRKILALGRQSTARGMQKAEGVQGSMARADR